MLIRGEALVESADKVHDFRQEQLQRLTSWPDVASLVKTPCSNLFELLNEHFRCHFQLWNTIILLFISNLPCEHFAQQQNSTFESFRAQFRFHKPMMLRYQLSFPSSGNRTSKRIKHEAPSLRIFGQQYYESCMTFLLFLKQQSTVVLPYLIGEHLLTWGLTSMFSMEMRNAGSVYEM